MLYLFCQTLPKCHFQIGFKYHEEYFSAQLVMEGLTKRWYCMHYGICRNTAVTELHPYLRQDIWTCAASILTIPRVSSASLSAILNC